MRALWWRACLLRGRFKVWWSSLWLLFEFCHDCGTQQEVVWSASDADWALFAEGQHPLCPNCFDARAFDAGCILRWTPVVSVDLRGLGRDKPTP